MTQMEMKQKSVRSNQLRTWIMLPAVLGVLLFIAFLTINDLVGTTLLYLGMVVMGLVLGYYLAGRNL